MSYDADFYKRVAADSTRTARRILPWLFHIHKPLTLVDVGCGTGAWLSIAKELGAWVTGIDMPEVQNHPLLFPQDRFIPTDLEAGIECEDHFDMALCIEVGEHLTPVAGTCLVSWLCRHANIIVWSAAIPQQVGVNHINEQWPSYWQPLFNMHKFYVDLAIRDQFWNDPEVGICVRQNIMVYSKFWCAPHTSMLNVVHPDIYCRKVGITYEG